MNMGFRGSRQNRDRLFAFLSARLRNESGQSIILVSIVILSFLMFFSFAINTGLLINAKISVQSAADAAAYAGAATQARQMNAISFLNYDMMRQYKKFLFRYVFVGSMGGNEFPAIKTPNTPQGGDYDFEKLDYESGTRAIVGLKVPVVCIPITEKGIANDNCLFVNMKSTAHAVASLSAGGNAIQNALVESLKQIEAVQANVCNGQGQINFFVLISWLFRADVSNAQLIAILTQLKTAANAKVPQADIDHAVQNINPLVTGLGLFPRNIIDLMRIQTLQGFINEPHALDVSSDQVSAWEKDTTISETKERTIQAFKSALSNLNTTVFDPSLLKMDELQQDQMLNLQNVLINFNAYVQQQSSDAPSINNGGVTICGSSIDAFPVINAPVGVKLGSPSQVNYAVHLKAFIRPHGLLYLPNSEPLELDAYAGAKPFGARIGPAALGQGMLTKNITPTPINGQPNPCDGTSQANCSVPYLQIGTSTSFYNVNYLADLTKKGKQPDGKSYSTPGILSAQAHAMAPIPEEVGRYNIIPPPKDDMRFEFLPYAVNAGSTYYRFYAPIFPSGKADISGKVNSFVDKLFEKTSVSDNVFHINPNDMRLALESQITGYITNSLVTGAASENHETQAFASIELPMPTTLVKGVSNWWLTTANQVLSSWAPTYGRVTGDADGFGFVPRFGYSVKFVTLHDLQGEGLPSEDADVANVSH